MPINVENPNGGTIDCPPDFLAANAGSIRLAAPSSRLVIAGEVTASHLAIVVGEGCTVRIGAGCGLGQLHIFTGAGSNVTIGELCYWSADMMIACHEPFDVTIGARCLFATGTIITVSDMHSILDAASGERINRGAPVTLGDHVWLGQGASVLKGVSIGADSVVALGAVVTNDVPPNSLVAGVPARIVRSGITWDHNLL